MATSILLRCGTVLYHDEHDRVTPLKDTDVLVEGNTITQIGRGLTAPSDATVIDCRDKIVSPGFIDTHHHLWQTQLKGRHADHTLFDYFPSGNWQGYTYTPSDTFWGQLGGCLEAIDSGTTFVLDHAHGCPSEAHATQALSATISSGLRSIYAYAHSMVLTKWNRDECIPSQDLMPEWANQQIEDWAEKQPFGDGRVTIGFGFDYYFLPKDMVVGMFDRMRKAGVKAITSHVAKNAVFGMSSTTETLDAYSLFLSSASSAPLVLSHANGMTANEKRILTASPRTSISTTPETEAQMGLGHTMAFEPGVRHLTSLGVDCHSSNTSFMPQQARTALLLARLETNQPLLDRGLFPSALRASTHDAFNLMTVQGAAAVGLEAEIGRIERGFRADLVVFDLVASPALCCAAQHDPVVAVVRHADVRDVQWVIVDGVVRKREGRLNGIRVTKLDGQTEGEVLEWKDVATELVRSRADIQGRIDGLSMDKAKDLLTAMFHIDEKKFVTVD